MRRRFLGMVLIGFLSGCATYAPPPGHGGIPPGHGGIPPGQAKKMGPPPIVVVGAPAYAVVPGTTISVMLGVEADVFLVGGVYYYFHDGVWYSASSHHGPWRSIGADELPPGLRGKSPKELKAKVKNQGKGGHGRGGRWGYQFDSHRLRGLRLCAR